MEIRAIPDDGHFLSTATGPDILIAGIVVDHRLVDLGRLDGRYVSPEVAGGMTGRLIGVWGSRGELLVTPLHYSGTDDAG